MKMKPVAAATVTLALGLSGCGGSAEPSLSAFKSAFKSDKETFRQLGLDLQKAITGAQAKTDAQLAAEIGSLATRASGEASSISKLNPPDKYKADTQKLSAGFRAVAVDLHSIATAAVKHDAAKAKQATKALLGDAAQVKAADDTITKGLGLPA
ncbi:MAG: hypothetical protein ACRDNK_24550 [Solirubrobacteraceae bacterium]